VARESSEGRSRTATLLQEAQSAPDPPPELAHLRESVLLDPVPDEVGDLRALLDDLPRASAIKDTE